MANENLLLHKISVAMINNVPISAANIEEYAALNLGEGEGNELSLLYMILAGNLKNSGQYLESLEMLDKAILSCQGDLSIKMDALCAVDMLNNLIESEAMENLSDIRVGPLYESLLKRGNVSMSMHAYAVLHYQKIGEFEKAKAINEKLTRIAPNFKLLKQRTVK